MTNTLNNVQQVVEYYVFDRIEKDEYGVHWGYISDMFCEVYPKACDETEQELISKGFALCDAPDTETMIVEISSFQNLLARTNANT